VSLGRVAVAAALVAGVAGCGGSGSSSTSSSGLSPAAYRASVNKICQAYNAGVTALPKSTTSSITGLTTLANSAKNALAQVRSVPAPAAMSASVDKWIANLEQSQANVAKLLDAFRSGDTAQLRTIAAEGTRLNAKGNAQARALGLTSCAANATPSG
jgi:hypothetical protein